MHRNLNIRTRRHDSELLAMRADTVTAVGSALLVVEEFAAFGRYLGGKRASLW